MSFPCLSSTQGSPYGTRPGLAWLRKALAGASLPVAVDLEWGQMLNAAYEGDIDVD